MAKRRYLWRLAVSVRGFPNSTFNGLSLKILPRILNSSATSKNNDSLRRGCYYGHLPFKPFLYLLNVDELDEHERIVAVLFGLNDDLLDLTILRELFMKIFSQKFLILLN